MFRLLSTGHNFKKKGPMKNGCRKWLILFMYNVCCSFYLFICGMKTTHKTLDVDYSYYLGPDYKRSTGRGKSDDSSGHVAKIVSPHVSCLDI